MIQKKELMTGNEAIARGAIEAGLSYASSYPGTPATEILEYLAKHFKGRAEWSVNEKVAYETALGASYTGRRALVSMKHVGLNVAADPLMTSAYLGNKGGFVVVVADDPGAYSSQNEQDTRIFARFAKIALFEPSDSQEAKDFIIAAFDLSEKYKMPVMLRSLTKLSHTSSPVAKGEIREENKLALQKDPAQLIAIPSNVVRLHKALIEKQKGLTEDGAIYNSIFKDKQKKGIIVCGIAYNYAMEYAEDFAVLKVSFYPVDEALLKDFVAGLEEVIVLEEGEPMIEELVRKYHNNVKGKLTGEINRTGEVGADALGLYLKKQTLSGGVKDLPRRPPVLCPGCGHRDLYTALKAAAPSFTAGDIGCYTLGCNPPLEALDSCLCMGASISKAAGIAGQGVKRVACVIGDSTFMHMGLPALISAVYNRANITVLILDNSSTAMTGHQPTPLIGITAKGQEVPKVILEELCKASGASTVTVIDPVKIEETTALIKEKLAQENGVNVIIARRPCVLTLKKK
jgi:indolepyruvate ferredoxin oxidoreductase alpha subunit